MLFPSRCKSQYKKIQYITIEGVLGLKTSFCKEINPLVLGDSKEGGAVQPREVKKCKSTMGGEVNQFLLATKFGY